MSKTATALEERLNTLQGADAASTEFIRTGLSGEDGRDAVPASASAAVTQSVPLPVQDGSPEAERERTTSLAERERTTSLAEDRVRRFLAENVSDSPVDIVILLGGGQPDEMDALLRCLPEPCKILLLERDAARIAGLFRHWPLETAVQKGKIVLALGTDRDHIHARFFGLMDMQRPPNVRFCDLPETTPEDNEFYTSVLTKIREIVHLTVFNLNTLLDRGPLWQYNTIKNLPHLLTHPGIATLAGLFAGRPAIVVGAGPSLNDALPSLRAAANRFAIFSTGTALSKLRKAGIRPDLVVAVDASRKTAPQFETRCDDVYLACSSIVYPPAIPKFKGIFSGQLEVNPIDTWLNTLGAPKGAWAAAGTVTTTAIDLAIRMGCNPVISVGFDLSFSDDGTTHASDTMYHGHRLDPRRLVRVPGNYRPDVPTTEQFHVYIRLLDEYVKYRSDIRFINATTGGAKLNGMELMRPEELAALAMEPFDAAALIEGVHQAYAEDVLDAARDELRTVAAELNIMAGNAQEAARLSNRLIMLLRAPHKEDETQARELLNTLDTLDRQFLDMGRPALFLDMSLWPGAYQNRTRRTDEEASFSEGVWVNRRSRQLYEQIVGAATWTRLLLLDVVDELGRRRPDSRPVPARSATLSVAGGAVPPAVVPTLRPARSAAQSASHSAAGGEVGTMAGTPSASFFQRELQTA